MESKPNQSIGVTSVGDIITTFREKKLYLLVTPLLFGMIAVLYILLVPPRYDFSNSLHVRMPRFILNFEEGGWLLGDVSTLSLKDYWDTTSKIILLKAIEDKYRQNHSQDKHLPFKVNILPIRESVIGYKVSCREAKLCSEVSRIISVVTKTTARKLFIRRAITIAATRSQNAISRRIIELITNTSSSLYKEQESLSEEIKILEDSIASIRDHIGWYENKKKTKGLRDAELISYYLFKEYDAFFDKKIENTIRRKKLSIALRSINEKRNELTKSFIELQKVIDKIELVDSEKVLTERLNETYDEILNDLRAYLPVMTKEEVSVLIEPQFLQEGEGGGKLESNRLASWAIIVSAMLCGLIFSSLVIITFAVVRDDRRRTHVKES